MPARTGRSYTVPGGGVVVRSKSGKAKSFSGKGPAPAGTKKVKPKTAATAPTVTVAPTGAVSTSSFPSQAAATAAKQKVRRSRQRVRRKVASTEHAEKVALRSSQNRARAKRDASASTQPLPPELSKYVEDPRKAVISSRPNPTAKPDVFGGQPTAGTPTRAELQTATRKGTLHTNRKGFVTTPRVRKASRALTQARKAVRRSGPSLAGLAPPEKEVAHLARQAHRKFPDVPVSVLMGDTKQESGFNAAAVSSAGAQGLTQFIPSTAASYGVKYGTGKAEKRSQVIGQAHLLHDNLKDSGSMTEALNDYLGLSSQSTPSEYSASVLANAAGYKSLDRPGNPRAQRRLVRARRGAIAAGLKVKGGSAVGPAPKKVVTRYKAAKVAMKEVEGLPYVWGGGHGSPTSSPTGGGLDCSGAVGYVLNKIGAMHGSATSGDMGQYLKPGPGLLTVFYNGEHTFLRLGNEYWGTSVGDSGAGGLGPHGTPSASYLAAYNVGHVSGMGRKQALQMGFRDLGATPTGGGQPFPGMTLSSSGTTATIDPGAGATKKGKPGFSTKPIQVSPFREAMQTAKLAKALGSKVHIPGEAKAEEASSPAGNTELSRLERKYGKAAV